MRYTPPKRISSRGRSTQSTHPPLRRSARIEKLQITQYLSLGLNAPRSPSAWSIEGHGSQTPPPSPKDSTPEPPPPFPCAFCATDLAHLPDVDKLAHQELCLKKAWARNISRCPLCHSRFGIRTPTDDLRHIVQCQDGTKNVSGLKRLVVDREFDGLFAAVEVRHLVRRRRRAAWRHERRSKAESRDKMEMEKRNQPDLVYNMAPSSLRVSEAVGGEVVIR